MDILDLNRHAWERVAEYHNLKAGNTVVSCPYVINLMSRNMLSLLQKADADDALIPKALELYKQRAVGYGWFRGKGTPEQLEYAIAELAKQHGYDLDASRPEGIVEFMKLFGLGVDCSGLVWNVLAYAWEKAGRLDDLLASFAWPEGKTPGPDYAGADFLARHATLVDPVTVQAMDLVCMKAGERYTHIGIILLQNDELKVVQSNICNVPTGIDVSDLCIENNQVNFGYAPAIGKAWNDFPAGMLEIRRLNASGL